MFSRWGVTNNGEGTKKENRNGGGVGAVPCGFPAGQVPERPGMFI